LTTKPGGYLPVFFFGKVHAARYLFWIKFNVLKSVVISYKK
jgi:hypothetical protein